MDSLSRDDRDRHLITRGNVDGIVSAALFLRAFPRAKLTFVTSPSAAARALEMDASSSTVYLADIAPASELEHCISMLRGKEIVLFDHHQCHPHTAMNVVCEEGVSAASVLHRHFGLNGIMAKLVAIADLVEYCESDLLREQGTIHGRRKLEDEARVLDFSWRLDIDDDLFRAHAAAHLSRGIWPSEVGMIKRRYTQVVNEQRWPKALSRVRGNLSVRGQAAVLSCKDKNRSLYGFGTRALVEVAREKGCAYAIMINQRKLHSSVSLRGLSGQGINLGRFAEDFTAHYGVEGGGHPTSAGARIPVESTDLFLEEFMAASSR